MHVQYNCMRRFNSLSIGTHKVSFGLHLEGIKKASYRTTISDLDASVRVFEICLLPVKIAILQAATQDPLRGLKKEPTWTRITHTANKFHYLATFADSVTI